MGRRTAFTLEVESHKRHDRLDGNELTDFGWFTKAWNDSLSPFSDYVVFLFFLQRYPETFRSLQD